MKHADVVSAACLVLAMLASTGAALAAPPAVAVPEFDPELAKRLGADERGMRSYVLVVLKTGQTPVTDPDRRKEMFAGHFANMERLAAEGKLAVAGPFAKNDEGWRGLFILAVDSVDEARALAATDPVIEHGEMIAEYHPWYGSAALMMATEIHHRLTPKEP